MEAVAGFDFVLLHRDDEPFGDEQAPTLGFRRGVRALGGALPRLASRIDQSAPPIDETIQLSSDCPRGDGTQQPEGETQDGVRVRGSRDACDTGRDKHHQRRSTRDRRKPVELVHGAHPFQRPLDVQARARYGFEAIRRPNDALDADASPGGRIDGCFASTLLAQRGSFLLVAQRDVPLPRLTY